MSSGPDSSLRCGSKRKQVSVEWSGGGAFNKRQVIEIKEKKTTFNSVSPRHPDIL